VAWNGSYYHDIKILNGVRQGAVLSPGLVCIFFFDELIRWSQQNMGAILVSVSLVYLHIR